MNDRQRRFVDEYLIDLNATQAAIRAGYSPKTAKAIASENLTKPDIAAELADRRRVVAERAQLTVDSHLAELASLRDNAKRAEQYAAAVAAETRRGEVAGFYVKRREDVTKLSREERAERLKRLLKLA